MPIFWPNCCLTVNRSDELLGLMSYAYAARTNYCLLISIKDSECQICNTFTSVEPSDYANGFATLSRVFQGTIMSEKLL